MRPWKIWVRWFDDKGNQIGAVVYQYEYKYKGNAVRAAMRLFNEPDCEWIVSQDNPFNK
jgi:hypothetical protein